MNKLLLVALALTLCASVCLTGCNQTGKTDQAKDDAKKTEGKTPEIPPQEKEAVETALKSLLKLESLTKTGITYNEYSSRLLDIKPDFDLALAKVPNSNPIRRPLDKAMLAFVEARNYWKNCIDHRGYPQDYFMNTVIENDFKAYYADFLAELKKPPPPGELTKAQADAQLAKNLRLFTEQNKKRPLESHLDVNLLWEYASSEIKKAKEKLP